MNITFSGHLQQSTSCAAQPVLVVEMVTELVMQAVITTRVTTPSPSSFRRLVSVEWKKYTFSESALPIMSDSCKCWLSWALVLHPLDQVHQFQGLVTPSSWATSAAAGMSSLPAGRLSWKKPEKQK